MSANGILYFMCRRHSLLLIEVHYPSADDAECSANLPSFGASLISQQLQLLQIQQQHEPVTADRTTTTTVHFVTTVLRLLVEVGRLHRRLVTKVMHAISYL